MKSTMSKTAREAQAEGRNFQNFILQSANPCPSHPSRPALPLAPLGLTDRLCYTLSRHDSFTKGSGREAVLPLVASADPALCSRHRLQHDRSDRKNSLSGRARSRVSEDHF